MNEQKDDMANRPGGGGSMQGAYGSEGGAGNTGGTATEVVDKAKEQLSGGVEKAKEQVSASVDKAKEQIDGNKDKAATGLETAAEKIKGVTGNAEGAPAQAGVKLAEGMESAAGYLKEHSSDEILKDFETFVKEHPAQALVGAVFAGFLFGRILR